MLLECEGALAHLVVGSNVNHQHFTEHASAVVVLSFVFRDGLCSSFYHLDNYLSS